MHIVAKHPWSSLRDFIVLGTIMLFAILMAQQYDCLLYTSDAADE